MQTTLQTQLNCRACVEFLMEKTQNLFQFQLLQGVLAADVELTALEQLGHALCPTN